MLNGRRRCESTYCGAHLAQDLSSGHQVGCRIDRRFERERVELVELDEEPFGARCVRSGLCSLKTLVPEANDLVRIEFRNAWPEGNRASVVQASAAAVEIEPDVVRAPNPHLVPRVVALSMAFHLLRQGDGLPRLPLAMHQVPVEDQPQVVRAGGIDENCVRRKLSDEFRPRTIEARELPASFSLGADPVEVPRVTKQARVDPSVVLDEHVSLALVGRAPVP